MVLLSVTLYDKIKTYNIKGKDDKVVVGFVDIKSISSNLTFSSLLFWLSSLFDLKAPHPDPERRVVVDKICCQRVMGILERNVNMCNINSDHRLKEKI